MKERSGVTIIRDKHKAMSDPSQNICGGIAYSEEYGGYVWINLTTGYTLILNQQEAYKIRAVREEGG